MCSVLVAMDALCGSLERETECDKMGEIKEPSRNEVTQSAGAADKGDPLGELQRIWHNFKRAVRSIEPFDQWYWIRVLCMASANCVFYVAKQKLPFLKKWKIYRQLVPCFAIFLVVSLLSTYFFILRNEVVLQRWCSKEVTINGEHGSSFPCKWAYVHDTVVFYLGMMILWNYLITVFSSPGVALPSHVTAMQRQHQQTSEDLEYVWNSADGRGGCCFINSIPVNNELERSRVERYTPKKSFTERFIEGGMQNQSETKPKKIYFPSLNCSTCEKCLISRPPRCHHCSVCNRCVLQMDHHCIWMNTCIGYANYRSFLLSLFFITLACIYGTILLLSPFKEILREQIAQQGFWTCIWSLRVPPLWELITRATHTSTDRAQGFSVTENAIKIAFPFLLGVSITMVAFLSLHLRIVAQGITTLERIIQLDEIKLKLLSCGNSKERPVFINPYNQGFFKNICQVFGKNFLSALLPVRVEPPHPYFPLDLGEPKKQC